MSSTGDVFVRQFTVNVKGKSVKYNPKSKWRISSHWQFLVQNNHLFTNSVNVMYILHVQCHNANLIKVRLIECCLWVAKLVMITIT